MFLFILESLGTTEIIIIAGAALVLFGPRKLPQMVKTISRTMAEFRRATSEFKQTWEKEVDFDHDLNPNSILNQSPIARETTPDEHVMVGSATDPIVQPPSDIAPVVNGSTPPAPAVKELSTEEAMRIFQDKIQAAKQESQPSSPETEETKTEKFATAKRDWI